MLTLQDIIEEFDLNDVKTDLQTYIKEHFEQVYDRRMNFLGWVRTDKRDL